MAAPGWVFDRAGDAAADSSRSDCPEQTVEAGAGESLAKTGRVYEESGSHGVHSEVVQLQIESHVGYDQTSSAISRNIREFDQLVAIRVASKLRLSVTDSPVSRQESAEESVAMRLRPVATT